MSQANLTRVRAAVAAAALLGLTACGAAAGSEGSTKSTAPHPSLLRASTLTVCRADNEPFSFDKGGEVVGFDVDLVTEIAKELDVKVAYITEDFDDIASGQSLSTNTCDIGAAAISIDGDRARVVDFSSPYFDAAQVMVAQPTSGVTTLAEAAGKRIGVVEDATGDSYATDNAPPETKIVKFKSLDEMGAAFTKGTIDAGIYNNKVVGEVIGGDPTLAIVEEFPTGKQYGLAVKKDGGVDLLRVINNVIADLQSSGKYDEMYQKWFGKTTVG